ncbi:hypothetical protein V8B97DRAFT_371909 [Scleroderma yunnanense]
MGWDGTAKPRPTPGSATRPTDTMSSPIPINPSSSRHELYIPIHRRALSTGISSPSSYAWSSSSRASSPTPSDVTASSLGSTSSSQGFTGNSSLPIYTPADLILLSSSPLSKLSQEHKEILRTTAPAVMLSRK